MTDDIEKLLDAYLDSDLSEAQRAAVEARAQTPSVARRLAAKRRVRDAVRRSAPLPSAQQSARMWAGIRESVVRAQVTAAEKAPVPVVEESVPDPLPDWSPAPRDVRPPTESWTSFFTRPWVPRWGLGLAGAAVALAVVLLVRPPAVPVPATPAAPRPQAPAARSGASSAPTSASAARRAVAPAAALARSKASPAVAAARPRPASAATEGPTEVERALADNQVDAMIQQLLEERRQAPGLTPALGGARSAPLASLGNGSGATTVGYQVGTTTSMGPDALGPVSVGNARGTRDANGFWNWNPAALALNAHDWGQARAELEAASRGAGAASERAFADSALTLLSVPGAPLDGTLPALPSVGDLRVLGAGRWQLQVDQRVARFAQGVSVRLPGFRVEGDSLALDLTFDRATFGPGAHFIRLAGEAPARVFDANHQPVSTDDFYAPVGADYNIPDREVRLR